jgi:hypothetical protein
MFAACMQVVVVDAQADAKAEVKVEEKKPVVVVDVEVCVGFSFSASGRGGVTHGRGLGRGVTVERMACGAVVTGKPTTWGGGCHKRFQMNPEGFKHSLPRMGKLRLPWVPL